VIELTWADDLSDQRRRDVRALLDRAEQVDGVAPVGEHVLIRLRPGATGSAHLVAVLDGDADGVVAGYAQLDLAGDADGRLVAELAVAPEHRRRGVGAALATAVLERAGSTAVPGAAVPEAVVPNAAVPDRAGSAEVRFWAHGDLPAAAGLAARLGLSRVRELRRMRVELTEPPVEPELPAGVSLRAFRPGADEAAVVAVNRRAFSWHPEQGAMTEADVRDREAEDWFDPAGFLLAVDERDALVGFHWTKVHPGGLGEVYVVGVDPDRQGGGLGRALTLAGLAHLWRTGIRRVMLYVESDNAPAVRVYARLGFELWNADVQYQRVG
jgi:mycothiol synthase